MNMRESDASAKPTELDALNLILIQYLRLSTNILENEDLIWFINARTCYPYYFLLPFYFFWLCTVWKKPDVHCSHTV
jgi:hypothetical protein